MSNVDKLFYVVPWIVALIIYTLESVKNLFLQWQLSKALERAQGIVPETKTAPVPSSTVVPPKTPVVPATPDEVVDEALAQAVKKFEGFSAKAFWDYKQYSIGYGTKANSPDEIISEPEAVNRLQTELANAEKSVEKFCPGAPKGVKQALTSLTYNAGTTWQSQTLGALIKAGEYEEAKSHFIGYNHAGGQVNNGLTTRRNTEVKWFDKAL